MAGCTYTVLATSVLTCTVVAAVQRATRAQRAEFVALASSGRVYGPDTAPRPAKGVWERLYRKPVENMLKKRAQWAEEEAAMPDAMKQWKWLRLNAGTNDYGWARQDRWLSAGQRCPICSATLGHGVRSLYMERLTTSELRKHAEEAGVARQLLDNASSNSFQQPAQTRERILKLLDERHHWHHEMQAHIISPCPHHAVTGATPFLWS